MHIGQLAYVVSSYITMYHVVAALLTNYSVDPKLQEHRRTGMFLPKYQNISEDSLWQAKNVARKRKDIWAERVGQQGQWGIQMDSQVQRVQSQLCYYWGSAMETVPAKRNLHGSCYSRCQFANIQEYICLYIPETLKYLLVILSTGFLFVYFPELYLLDMMILHVYLSQIDQHQGVWFHCCDLHFSVLRASSRPCHQVSSDLWGTIAVVGLRSHCTSPRSMLGKSGS